MDKITDNIKNEKVKEYFDQVTQGQRPTSQISPDEYEEGLRQVLDNLDTVLADGRAEVARRQIGTSTMLTAVITSHCTGLSWQGNLGHMPIVPLELRAVVFCAVA